MVEFEQQRPNGLSFVLRASIHILRTLCVRTHIWVFALCNRRTPPVAPKFRKFQTRHRPYFHELSTTFAVETTASTPPMSALSFIDASGQAGGCGTSSSLAGDTTTALGGLL